MHRGSLEWVQKNVRDLFVWCKPWVGDWERFTELQVQVTCKHTLWLAGCLPTDQDLSCTSKKVYLLWCKLELLHEGHTHTVAYWVSPTDQLQDTSCTGKRLHSYKSGSDIYIGTKLSCITVLWYHSWEVSSFQEPLPNLWAQQVTWVTTQGLKSHNINESMYRDTWVHCCNIHGIESRILSSQFCCPSASTSQWHQQVLRLGFGCPHKWGIPEQHHGWMHTAPDWVIGGENKMLRKIFICSL